MSILLLTHCALSLQPSAEAASPWELPQGALTLGGQWETAQSQPRGSKPAGQLDQRWGPLSAEPASTRAPPSVLSIASVARHFSPSRRGARSVFCVVASSGCFRSGASTRCRAGASLQPRRLRAELGERSRNAVGSEQISNIEVDLTGSLHAGPWLGLGARGHRDSLYYEHLLVAQWLSPLVGVGEPEQRSPHRGHRDLPRRSLSTRDFSAPSPGGLHSADPRVLALQLQAGGVERRRSQVLSACPMSMRAYESGTGWGHYPRCLAGPGGCVSAGEGAMAAALILTAR